MYILGCSEEPWPSPLPVSAGFVCMQAVSHAAASPDTVASPRSH